MIDDPLSEANLTGPIGCKVIFSTSGEYDSVLLGKRLGGVEYFQLSAVNVRQPHRAPYKFLVA